MVNITTKNLGHAALYALMASLTIVSLLFTAFFLAEPSVGYGQTVSNDFRIRQIITDESSFMVQPSNVTMVGNIAGVTGGNATGTTYFVVKSNNSTGYYVEIDFFDNAGSYAMRGDSSGSEALRDYSGDVSGQPSYNFTASTAAQFAYNVVSSTTLDSDDSFLNNGSNVCNTALGSASLARCWKAPSNVPFAIVNRNTSAVNGATTTVQFKVNVPSGATPVPQAETYTATATLSLFIQ